MISCKDNLTEDFIREFKDKVDWESLSHYRKGLSEDFIREFQDKVDKEIYFILSKFIKRFHSRVSR